jgi:NADPH2:quinone reductase
MGVEGTGTVERVGDGVTDFIAGNQVVWTGVPGSYATHVIVPAERLVLLPEKLGVRDGAAAMLQGLTAHYLSHSAYALERGDTCLVHAAAGGVGLLLCQMGKMIGARVIGTVSTETKAKLAQGVGADDVIIYTRDDFETAARRLTAGRGLDVVYDSVGHDTFEKSLNCLARRGALILYGRSRGPVPPVDLQVLNAKGSLSVTWPSLYDYVETRSELLERARALFGWISADSLRLRVERTYGLTEAGAAHRALAERQTTGKILLLP